jgi:glutamate-1-semialdehyde 2,1-aminomutase
MAGAAAAAVASGISARPAAPRRALAGRRARPSVVRAAISVEKGEKAYTVQKSEEIFNAAKVPLLSDSSSLPRP